MNESTIQQIKDALEPLAHKIGQGAEFLYRVYYKQTIIDGVLEIVGSLLAIVALFFIARKVIKYIKPEMFDPNIWMFEYDTQEERNELRKAKQNKDANFLKWMIGFFAGLIIFFVSFATFDGIKHVANPPYYTINRLVESVRSGGVQK